MLHTALEIQSHMQAQDREIEKILLTLERIRPAEGRGYRQICSPRRSRPARSQMSASK